MGILPASLLACTYAFTALNLARVQAASSGEISLGADITAFIPSCAQPCFISFLDSNFPPSICSANPTLDCLCTSASSSGFTVGEGAVQCIVSETNVGFCQGMSGSTMVARNAYYMCFGKQNALPNTHPTLTATLIIQSPTPSIVLVTPSSTRLTPGSTTSSAIPTSTTSSSPPTADIATTPPPSTSPTFTPTLTSTSTTSPPIASQDPIAITQPPPKLTTAQVAGISVAAAGVAVLALGGLCLAGCLRRRRRRMRDSELIPFQDDPGISMPNGFRGPTEKPNRYYGPPGGPSGGSMSAGGVAANWTPQRPFRDPNEPMDAQNMFARRSVQLSDVGAAGSPQIRYPSKLLPAKPHLNLEVPQPETWQGQAPLPISGAPIPRSEYVRYPYERDSTATQFEEDYSTTFNRVSGEGGYSYETASEYKIPPAAAYVNPQRPTIFIPPPDKIEPLHIRKNRIPPSIAVKAPPRIYTAQGTRPGYDAAHHDSVGYGWRPTVPQPAHPLAPAPPTVQQYRTYQPYLSASDRSVNTDNSAGHHDRGTAELRTAELSPVAESPVGTSPVAYPRIPPLSPATKYPRVEKQSALPKADAARNDPFSNILVQPEPPRPNSAMSGSSNSSSLIEKRRGPKQAGMLTLEVSGKETGKKLWAVQPDAEKRHRGLEDPFTEERIPLSRRQDNPEQVPPTPTWARTLTPKVGDRGELILDVR